MAEVAKPTNNKTSFQDKDKPTEVRLSNIVAAKGSVISHKLHESPLIPDMCSSREL